jgi:hypothetical protein
VSFFSALWAPEYLLGFDSDAEQNSELYVDLFTLLDEVFRSCDPVIDLHA